MRRLVSLVFAGAMVATLAGTALAAPNRSATLGGCLYGTTGVQTTTDWAGYHPDTLVNVAWTTGSSTVYSYSESRSVDWKFGTSTYDTSFATWSTSAPALAFTADTSLAVQLYRGGRFLVQTNAIRFGDLTPCV